MGRKKAGLLFLIFSCPLLLLAQIVPFERYTSKNGLVADRITTISQDAQGFMWFGSYFGISRYNGIAFERVALPPSQQNKYVVFLQPAGRKMYAGFLFNGGLFEYDNGRIRSYFIRGEDSASANEFVCMTDEGDGRILVCNSSNKIFRFENGKFSFVFELPNRPLIFPKTILKDSYNNIWVGTEKGLFIISDSCRKMTQLFPNMEVFSIVRKYDGRIWLSRSDGINSITSSYAGWNGQIVDERIEFADHNLRAVALRSTNPRAIWGVDGARGLFMYNHQRGKTFYDIPLDLHTDISSLFIDRENNIWIANEPGVFKISNFNSKFYPFSEMAAGGGQLHWQNDSVLWASNAKGLYYISADKITKVAFQKPLPDYFTLLLVDNDDNLWLGSWNQGLWKAKYHPGVPMTFEEFSSFGNKKVKPHAMTEDKEKNIWVTGINGVFRIRNGTIRDSYQPLNAAGGASFIVSIVIDEDRRTMWLGDNASGVIEVQYVPRENKPYDYKVVKYIGLKEGMNDTYVRSLYLDHFKNLWVGTRFGGIYRVQQNDRGYTVKNFNAAAGISCTRIADINEEDTVAMWFAACDGMYRYEHATGKWNHYSTSDGVQNSEIYDILPDKKNGYVWSLGGQGVNRLTPIPGQRVAPLVSITSITVLGKRDTNAMASSSVLRYASDQNSIGFSFAGASFIDEKRILYRYMLEGYDHDWSEPVITNNVNYASLPPGNYVFRVKAANAKGQWSEQPASFAFEIVLPFYKRPWFIFLLITVAIFIIYAIRIQRLRQRYRIEKLRLNIAQDLHDDIGSTLGSINLLSKTAKRRLDKKLAPEEISPIFQKIGESAENTLEAMDDIVWSINPKKDKIEDLLIRMREFAIPLFEAKNLEFDFKANDDHQGKPIPMNLRRNAFLIYKESIHNILKHSDATCASIELYLNSHSFAMCISDNGKGFSKGQPSNRNGLQNMQSRAALVQGKLEIDSSADGTTVKFEAPVK